MNKYFSRFAAPLALSVAVLLGACSAETKSDALATDTTLNRDLQLAGTDTTAQPALTDVATPAPATKTTPAKVTPKPAPKAKAPATSTTASGNSVTTTPKGSAAGGKVGLIASGTDIGLRSNSRVCTNTYTVGQTFNATTETAITGSNGAVIPAGATISLEITNLKRSENATDKIVFELAPRSLSFAGTTYPISGSITNMNVEKVRNQPKDKDVQKVVGGAVVGAIAGKILGKSTKATVGGAVAGAAAGAGVAAGTANYEGCVADGGGIVVTLSSPLQIKVAS